MTDFVSTCREHRFHRLLSGCRRLAGSVFSFCHFLSRLGAWVTAMNRCPGHRFPEHRTRAARFAIGRAWSASAMSALFLLGNAPAYAQTTIDIVSNVGLNSLSAGGNSLEYAQGFTTGANANEFFITGIDVRFAGGGTPSNPVVQLVTGIPDAFQVVHTLTAPNSINSLATEANIFTLPANTKLQPNTEYFVFYHADSVSYPSASGGGEDAGGVTGWSIADNPHWRTKGSSDTWNHSDPPRLMRIIGQVDADADSTVPTLQTATVNSTELTLTYSELLDTTSVPAASSFTVNVGTNSITVSSVSINTRTVTLNLATAVVQQDGNTVTVSYAVPTSNPIRDLAQNNAGALSAQAVTNESPVGVTLSVTTAGTTVVTGDGIDFTVTPDVAPGADFRVQFRLVPAGDNPVDVPASGSSEFRDHINPANLSDVVAEAGIGRGLGGFLDFSNGSADSKTVRINLQDPTGSRAATIGTTFSISIRTVSATPAWVVLPTTVPVITITDADGGTEPPAPPPPPPPPPPGSFLVSNVSQPVHTTSQTVGTGFSQAQAFTTGSNSAGYVVSSVGIRVVSGTTGVMQVRLFTTNAQANPDTEVATLTPPASITVDEINTFTASDGVMLNANTTYAVVVNKTSGVTSNIATTTSTSEDSGSQAGWSIDNNRHINNNPQGWRRPSSRASLIIIINAGSDMTAPSLSTATVVGDTISLTYGEQLDSSSVPTASAFSVTVDSGAAVNPSNVEISGSTVTLTLATAVTPGQSVTVSYTVPTGAGANPIQDAAGNDALALSGQTVTNNTTPPLVLPDPDDIEATEGAALTSTPLAAATGGTTPYTYEVTGLPSGTGITVSNDSPPVIGGTPNAADLTASPITVTYMVTDDVGDEASQEFTITVTAAPDTTAPVLQSAEVNATSLTLTFDETLAAAPNLANSAFTVTKTTGAPSTVVLEGTPTITGSQVELTLASASAAVSGDVLTVAYVKPTSGTGNRIADATGNETDDFSVPSTDVTEVTNSTPSSNLSIADATVGEGDGTISFTVTLDRALPRVTTLAWYTSGSTGSTPASVGSDYTSMLTAEPTSSTPAPVEHQFTIAANETTATISVTITDDELFEFDTETFEIIVTGPEGTLPAGITLAASGDARATGSIMDDDMVTFGFDPTTYEIAEDGVNVSVNYGVLSGQLGREVNLRIQSSDGTAIAGTNYVAYNITELLRNANSSVDFLILDTDRLTGPVDFTVALSVDASRPQYPDSSRIMIDPDIATVTITQGDQPPLVLGDPANITATEGTALTAATLPAATGGTEPYTYAVTGEPSGTGITVSGDSPPVISGTPNAADRAASPIRLTYTVTDASGGTAMQTFDVTVEASTPSDTIRPTLQSAEVNATTLTLTFDEALAAAPNLANSAFEVTKTTGTPATVVLEGTPTISGTQVVLTLASASAAVHGDVFQVVYNGPATGTDNRLTDAVGNDVDDFFVPNADISEVTNSTPPPSSNLSIASADVGEAAGTASFTVTLDRALQTATTLAWYTPSGTATAGSDYTSALTTAPTVSDPAPSANQFTIPANTTTGNFTVSITDDALFEYDTETFNVTVTGVDGTLPTGIALASAGDDTATGTIRDDDTVTIGFDPATYTVREDQTGVWVTYGVLSGLLERTVNIKVLTSDGTASGATHYTPIDTNNLLDGDNNDTPLRYNVNIRDTDSLTGPVEFTIALSVDTGIAAFPDSPRITTAPAATITITPGLQPLTLASPSAISARQAVALTDTPLPAATGGTAPYMYGVSGLPSGTGITVSNDSPPVIGGTPNATDQGASPITLIYTVTDSATPNAATTTSTFTITVSPGNRTPTVATMIPDQSATTGMQFSYTFPADTFNDADGDTLTYTTSTLPGWLSFDAGTRAFTGTPTATGTHTVTVTATDPDSASVSDDFDIRVMDPPPPNDPPMVVNPIPNQTATTGVSFSYQIPANAFRDTDSASLVFTALQSDGSALPAWLTFSANLQSFSGTPQLSDVGTVTVRVTVSDDEGGSASDDFDIVVSQPNRAPTVANAIPDRSATTGMAFSYPFPANTFSDADGDTLIYTSSGEPAWLTFNASNRTFSGTPTAIGTHTITVTASDGNGGTVNDMFVITVSQGNRAPTVVNAIPDQSVTESLAFSYPFPANTFNDADGDTLTYSAALADGSALPGWLSFDAGTRTFSGTPTGTGMLTIRVTASDGNGGTATDDFDLTATAATPVSLSLSGTMTVAEDGGITLSVTPSAEPTARFTVNWAVAAGSGANAISRTGDSGDDAGSDGDWPDLKVDTDASQGGGPGLGKGGTLTFAAGSTDAQRIRLEPFDDSIDEADETFTISFTGGGTFYPWVTLPATSPTITITDDDTAGVTVSGTTLSVAESGGTASYTVVLNTLPPGDVTVTPSSDATDNVTVTPETLTFTTGNWNTAQTVTVTGVNDDIDNPSDRMATISHAVSGYGSVTAANSVTVTVEDDEITGVVVNPDILTLDENGGTATYTVVLGSLPPGDVTVTPSGSAADSVTVMPATLTFTTGNWNTAQTVTVTGVDDDIDNPSDRVATISHTVSGYGSVTTANSVTVTVTDDDNVVAPMAQEQTVSITLAAVATRAVSAATESIGPRFDALPPPSLTVAGQPVTFSPTGPAAAAACSGTDGLLGRHRAGSLGSGGGCAVAYGSRGVTPGELLGSSAFSVTLGATHGTGPQTVQWSLWGRGDAGSFEGQPVGVSYDGRTRSAWLGADARAGRWVAGLAASIGTGETDYSITNDAEGQLETEITALWPYAGWTADSGLSLQGMLGVGGGELRQIGEETTSQKLSLQAGVLGLSWHTPRLTGPALAVRVDASLAELDVTGDEEQGTDDLSVGSWRLRGGIETSWHRLLSGGGMIEPFLEAVARRDGGDGLVGTGIELAGGLRYVSSRVQAEARGRWLASHAEAGVRESGASATLRVKPLPGGRGLSLSLGPRWGADTGGADALWQEGLPGLSEAERVTLDARMGYGLGLGRRGLMTPFAETGGNDSRLGVRLRAGSLPVEAELASEADGYSARIGMQLQF